jgi:pimeloyl-ACP methyl ester carboxylesterase
VRRVLYTLVVLAGALMSAPAVTQSPATIGIVIMHGKGGNPNGLVRKLADGLESKGYRVANLEMPWSGKREYDVSVAAAEQEVDAALARLRSAGATKLFVAGHSQGGVFALHFAGKHPLDGLILIAPGGNVGSRFYQNKVGSSVSLAREMVASGKANERGEFMDYEGSQPDAAVHTTAAIYLTWFDRDGAMNQMNSTKALPATLPVLFVAPTDDYPGLRRVKGEMFNALPSNPLSKLYEPNASHRSAPTASLDEIVRWTTEVAAHK